MKRKRCRKILEAIAEQMTHDFSLRGWKIKVKVFELDDGTWDVETQ